MTEILKHAQNYARSLGHNFISSEMILLGILDARLGIAANALYRCGANPGPLRREIEKSIGRGSGFVAIEIPVTPRAKRVLELSWQIARDLGHNYLGSEHLLLGLLAEESCATKTLQAMNVDIEKVKQETYKLINQREERQKQEKPTAFNSQEEKHRCLQQIAGQIAAWHNRAIMAKQQQAEDLVRQALERKWQYEKQYAEASNIDPPDAPQDPDDLPDYGGPGDGEPPLPSGVPRRPKPSAGDTAVALEPPKREESEEERQQ